METIAARGAFTIPLADGSTLSLGSRTLVMGIVNATPDSFAGGVPNPDDAAALALGMQEAGADIIDIGGESTRPGAAPVPVDAELERVVPLVEALAREGILVSVDTQKPDVMRAALAAGAGMVNDVRALQEPGAIEAVVAGPAAVCLMHMQGEPRTMQADPQYGDVMRDIALYLRRALARAAGAGVAMDRVIVDPGIGFGKTLAHNMEIIRRLPVLASLGRPILMGCSRKSMIGRALGLPVEERLNPTIALNVLSMAGRASIIRVHDVRDAKEAAAMADAVLSAGPKTFGER